MSKPPNEEETPTLRIVMWALVFVILLAVRLPGLAAASRVSDDQLNDFFQDWASARYYFDGIPVYASQEAAVRRYLGWRIDREPGKIFNEVNAHPPSSILLFLPFASLPYPDAARLWGLIWLCTLPISFWLIARALALPLPWWSVFPIGSAFLICGPLIEEITYGQLNLLLLLCATGAWVAERSGRPTLAGCLLGLCAAVKVFPAFLILPFLVRRRWAVVLSAGLTVLAITALTAAVLGAVAYSDYWRKVVPHVSGLRDGWPNISASGFFARLFHSPRGKSVPLIDSPALATAATVATTLIILAALVQAGLRARTEKAGDHLFSLTLCGMLLVSPITWPHYLLQLLLPALLLWRDLPHGGWMRPAYFTALMIFLVRPFFLYQLATGATPQDWDTRVALPWQSLTALGVQTYALAVFFVLGWLAFREAAGEPPPAE